MQLFSLFLLLGNGAKPSKSLSWTGSKAWFPAQHGQAWPTTFRRLLLLLKAGTLASKACLNCSAAVWGGVKISEPGNHRFGSGFNFKSSGLGSPILIHAYMVITSVLPGIPHNLCCRGLTLAASRTATITTTAAAAPPPLPPPPTTTTTTTTSTTGPLLLLLPLLLLRLMLQAARMIQTAVPGASTRSPEIVHVFQPRWQQVPL